MIDPSRRAAKLFRAGAMALAALLLLGGAAPALAQTSAPAGYDLLDGPRNGACLCYGSRGPTVAALQRALTAVGFPLSDDGIFGRLTLGAVVGFQRREGLSPDGVVGPRTVAALDRALGINGSTGGGATPGGGAGSVPGAALGTIPPRPPWAETGTDFMVRTAAMSRPAREAEILAAISIGNIPDFERRFQGVTVSITGPGLVPHVATYRVMPDYLAIGSDGDFVRIPMGAPTAQAIADLFGCSLPTRKMVNDIWQQAAVRLAPIPLTPGSQMLSNDYFLRHQRLIEGQRAGKPLGALTAGQKKDLVISNLLVSHPGRQAIYGWHLLNGQPIQPLSVAHEKTYADYSHGTRLIDAIVTVDGRPMAIGDVLRDSVLCRLLSDEGVIASPRVP